MDERRSAPLVIKPDKHVNKEQVEQTIKDVCPRCNDGEAVERRVDTGEWIHRPQGPHSVVLCLATHLRSKYQEVLNG
jgi:hypothetical protein